jgi:general stress protein 26
VEADGVILLAVEIVRAAPYGFVVTTEEAGPPSGRLVQHLAVDDRARVVFSTSPATRKARRIAATGELAYLVEDRQRFAYVSLSGRARLETSLAARQEHWEEGLRAFFPGGPEGDDFVLVVLETQRVELWSAADGVHPDPYGLAAATLTRTDEAWQRIQ